MPDANVSVTPYNGSLIGAQLLSAQRTLVLNNFGSSFSGTLTDNDGTLSDADDGLSSFNGASLNYIGSGTVQPGVNVLGVTVPLGVAKPVVVFEAGGQIYFHFPQGPPNLLGAVALVTNITSAPYSVFNPVCFVEGTWIATPDGDRLIETLNVGDQVNDIDGAPHEILWIGGRRMDLPIGLCPDYVRWLPVRVPAEAFGPGCPTRDLLVSQQHRLMIEGSGPELLFGDARVLVPAKALLGDVVALDRDLRQVTYYHILCRRHVILMANGLPSESLYPGPVAKDAIAQDALARPGREEAEALFSDLADMRVPFQPHSDYPMLRIREGRMLRPVARAAR
ncbi:Hint domain-containing protein [Fertoebacter nigrum]|uniref:Hint domain-containing protein n=1 Tax=Fertoeibacter niger TaxID=2656921 RepID=A0A8X8H3E8_9RHOB|nr:Hint domain-containing protein [Fertoeibacter niger]NUB46616.1 Hint domain-containing protein [Fertoeibacter niger]